MEWWIHGVANSIPLHPFRSLIQSSDSAFQQPITPSIPLYSSRWQGGRDSNPQPTVLETATLPIELPPYCHRMLVYVFPIESEAGPVRAPQHCSNAGYAMTSDTRPAPMVRPPSRIANRWPFSMATGAITLMATDTLSPGITISTPWGRATVPVTSVVRK